MDKSKVLIIGAGASGLTTAIMCARNHYDVTVLEANDKPGKKIYATGNGKCNLTNEKMDKMFYNGSDEKIIEAVLNRFGYEDTLKFFSELGVMFKNRNGYIYPVSGQASSIVEALVKECSLLNVKILCKQSVRRVEREHSGFKIFTDDNKYFCNKLVLSCGSSAGIDDSKIQPYTGYDIAKGFGHKIIPVVPSLTGLKCENKAFYKVVSGVRCDVRLEILSDGKALASEQGELQLTDYGISGIPVFQVCRHAGYSLKNKKSTYVTVDFMPECTDQELIDFISNQIEKNKRLSICQYLSGILNNKLAVGIVNYAGFSEKTTGKILDSMAIEKLVCSIKQFKDRICAVNDMKNAQVSAGGVSLKEITDTMASVYDSDLYITGELLDADGICGGYNLQWAWATGYIAGSNMR